MAGRNKLEAFGGCCNPMNLCILSDGSICTSESNLGRLKRYSAGGKLVSYIGTYADASGCKHVRVAAAPDGKRIYVADVFKGRIRVMEPK